MLFPRAHRYADLPSESRPLTISEQCSRAAVDGLGASRGQGVDTAVSVLVGRFGAQSHGSTVDIHISGVSGARCRVTLEVVRDTGRNASAVEVVVNETRAVQAGHIDATVSLGPQDAARLQVARCTF